MNAVVIACKDDEAVELMKVQLNEFANEYEEELDLVVNLGKITVQHDDPTWLYEAFVEFGLITDENEEQFNLELDDEENDEDGDVSEDEVCDECGEFLDDCICDQDDDDDDDADEDGAEAGDGDDQAQETA